MKLALKRLLNRIFYWSGLSPLMMRLVYGAKNRYLVLLYHRIRQPEHAYEASVTPVNFDLHLGYLKRFFQMVRLGELVTAIQNGQRSEKPLAALTFDDGFRDNYEAALPALKKQGVPAVIFAACGCLEGGKPMWTSRVEAMFRTTGEERLELDVSGEKKSYEIPTEEKKLAVCEEIKKRMKQIPDRERDLVLQTLEAQIGRELSIQNAIYSEMLSWDQLRALSQEPLIEIGSHTVTHRMLAQLERSEIDSELNDSKKMLEHGLQRPVRYVSYPGNSYDERVCASAEAAGYEAAFSVDRQLNHKGQDRYRIKRMHVEDGGVEDLLAELSLVLPFLRRCAESLKSIFKPTA